MTKLQQSIAEHAKEAFANHSIEKYCDIPGEGEANFGIWRCGKRDDQGRFSSYYYFRAIHAPGLLWVGGNVGDCEWRREYDMIAWARGSINDPWYFLSKVPQHIKREQFSSMS